MKKYDTKEQFMNSIGSVKCTCGYWNSKSNTKRYGTCTHCHKVIDQKAYFNHQLTLQLRLWRDKKWNY